ncbi:MAG: hypothetical protein RL328_2736 [Acidobacteriota bacterium]
MGRDAMIGVVLFGAMLVLAVLQYRWIGQVSEADRDRLQRGLRGAVNRFTDDFNGDIERLGQVLIGGGRLSTADQPLEARLELWRGLARHPQILKQVWMAEAPDLPEHLHMLRDRLPGNALVRRGGRGGRGGANLDGSIPAIALPRVRPAGPGDDTPLDWWIVEFDRAYMVETWLPELVMRDFGADYHVQVLNGADKVIYENEPGEGSEDPLLAPLFNLRQGPFGRGGRGGPPGGPSDFKGGPPPGFGGSRGDENGWRVVASYKSGSLTELAEGLRVRNLAVSFGILLLMGASVTMLMRSTRRANALALQQMEFVAGVTHELRTPLAVILSASQNLADGVASGEAQAKRYGGVIQAQTQRLSSMVEQVLRFAGLSSEHGIERAPVPVEPLIEEAVADCRAELDAARAEVIVKTDPDVPALEGDRAAMLHCLRNLLSNAAKHAQGAQVRVTAKAEGEMVEVVVEDRGPGIDAADLPHIFEPFYRGSRAKEAQTQGSGLGLSLVKKIVEAHGGTVDVVSRLGEGTTFRVRVPAVKG